VTTGDQMTSAAPQTETPAPSLLWQSPDRSQAGWLASAVATLRARLWLAALVTAIAVLIAVIWLRTTDYRYTAELRVAPAPTSARESSSLGALTSLATLTGATLEAIPVTPFRLYAEGIYTREVANRLARDPQLMRKAFAREWDGDRKQWRDPGGFGSDMTRGLYRLLGVPVAAWTPPDAARLQAWINANVALSQTAKTPIATISLADTDRAFAIAFLARLHTTVDGWLRERTLARTANNIDYLAQRLPGVTLADHRQALFATLSDQQQRQMMARNPAAYAAEPFGKATAGLTPSSPRQLPTLVVATGLGLFFGVILALAVPRRRRSA
jgi:hypothetical protein